MDADGANDEMLRDLESATQVWKRTARVVGAISAIAIFYLSGFVIGDRHPGLAFLTMMFLCPASYVLPVFAVEARHRSRLRESGKVAPRLTTSAQGTPVGTLATDERPTPKIPT